jgi:tripartite-type tricarboxylate transporter receptor subunit TctC
MIGLMHKIVQGRQVQRPLGRCAMPVAVLFLGCTLAAQAQTFGNGQLRIISPYPPGGGTDTLGRIISQRYTERFGHAAIVENRAGANGTIGAAYVAKSQGDGLTLLIVPAGYAANPALYRNLPYDQARDLAPVSLLASGPLVLVVASSLPVQTTRDLIQLAKARPGELNYGSPGNGGLPHLSAELFASMTGIKLTHIPYKGPSIAITDLIAGYVQIYFMNITQAIPLVEARKLRALGVTSPGRSPAAPSIPTIAEGGVTGYDMTNWYGLLVAATTPRQVIASVNIEVMAILKLPDAQKNLAAAGMVIEATSPERFAEFLRRESLKFQRVIDGSRISGTL